uniref:disease resistance protein Roq1-like n=1 Tax=Erigeron canadensis TaxID=72917 RepID=UPI001CB97508|nr:disease resistance protein Roq1-like [Erigeron canadensis]
MASDCDSSSSSKTNENWTYDVFLSFRGKDTRNSFVDHLYAALSHKNVYAFKDEMIHRGKLISPELLKAIEESRYAVVVFSENYANSSWCLEELAKIMECHKRMGQKVLPVFYHVNPSDVRGLKGKFAEAFQRRGKKFKRDPNKLHSWKEALVAASNISGLHYSKSDGGESEFISKIVQDILCNIKPYGMENNLIGIESHMDALNSLLDINATEEVRVVGILGMGGIGKTTIAQAIFQRIAYKFEGSSFLEDVRENGSNKKDICALQEKILRDILMRHDFNIDYPYQGAEMIQRRLSNKKLLLVLDDLNTVQQKDYLAASPEWFGKGSRIIITTRDEHMLSDAHVTHKPNLLSMDQAVQLFSWHAFRRNSPPEMYKELSYRAIRYTGYLPLALKVLGSFFYGRHNLNVWESALNRLAKAPNIEIFETLKLSFDGLNFIDKKIFLDIACFFKGKDEEHVTRILDSFGFDSALGITVLIERSLITISKKRLDMHDLIQEMGQQVARETFSNSRIWQIEEMHHLMRNRKLEAIEAIVLRDNEYNVDHYDEKLCFRTEIFRSMENLRLLDIDSKFPSHEPTFLPSELQWLCWHGYSFRSLPVECMRKLVGLQMVNSAIQHLWEGRKVLKHETNC